MKIMQKLVQLIIIHCAPDLIAVVFEDVVKVQAHDLVIELPCTCLEIWNIVFDIKECSIVECAT